MALKVKVLDEYCKGCGYCAHFCPNKAMDFGPVRNEYGAFPPVVAAPGSCIKCGICATVCPEAAIELREENANG